VRKKGFQEKRKQEAEGFPNESKGNGKEKAKPHRHAELWRLSGPACSKALNQFPRRQLASRNRSLSVKLRNVE
jgi:hypothetical protein